MQDIRDGQIYITVQIGTQCWMAENLNIGTRIDGVNEQQDNEIIEKYCYDDVETNCGTYGGLYQWDEIMEYSTTPGIQGICPTGWHMPTDDEWCVLEQEVDPTIICSSLEWRGYDVGGKLKESGTTHWNSPNAGATNSSGFTGLPGGGRLVGNFDYLKSNAYFWSSDESYYDWEAWARSLSTNGTQIRRHDYDKNNYGFSVRCLKNE